MKKLKFFAILLLTALLVQPFTAVQALEQPAVQSARVALVDANTGNVLFSKDADTKAYPAAATQIMTALLAVEAVENGKITLSDPVTFSADGLAAAASDDGKAVTFSAGETITMENLLYASLLASSPDACTAIAQHVAGNTNSFVEAMNARAKELGCTGTHFTNPSGAQDENHYTTAADLAKIARAAYGHTLFMEICNSLSRTIPATNASEERQLTNSNGLLSQDVPKYGRYYYQYAAGMKTGNTAQAGCCLVSSASKNGVKLLCVVLGGRAGSGDTSYTDYADTQLLYNWAFDNYEYREVIKQTENVKNVAVKMGREADTVAVHPEASVKVLVPKDEDVSDFTQKITIYSEQTDQTPLTAPVAAGTVLGEITAERGGQAYGTAKLLASNSVDLSYSQYLRARIAKTLLTPGAFAFFAIVAFLIIWYCKIVARYKRRVLKASLSANEQKAHPNLELFFGPETESEPEQTPEYTRKQSVPRPRKEKRRKAANRTGSVSVSPQPGGAEAEGAELPTAEDAARKAEEQAERDYFAEFFAGKSGK